MPALQSALVPSSPAPPVEAQDAGALPRALVGKSGAALLFLGGSVSLLVLVLPLDHVRSVLGLAGSALGGLLLGAIMWLLPWQRWPRAATLWFLPPTLALIAAANYFRESEAHLYALYFVMVFAWIGAGHPRWTSLRVMPVYVMAYLAPLAIDGTPLAFALRWMLQTGGVCILVAEALAWVSTRLSDTQTELHRREGEARFRSLIQHASDGIVVVDQDSSIQYQSPSMERLFGYSVTDLAATRLASVVDAEHVSVLLARLEDVSRVEGSEASAEIRMRHSGGHWRDVSVIATNLLQDPHVGGIVLNLRDVTDRKVLEDQLAHQAFHDPLTGLANRALFRERVEHAFISAQRDDRSCAILLVDLDSFKTVNDSLGHGAGDDLLVTVGERLRSSLRVGDTAARFGGDEFALLLEHLTDPRDAERAAERIHECLRAPIYVGGREVFVGASIGIVSGGPGAGGVDELLRDADVAMYMAKARGKGRWVVFEPSMQVAALERLQLEADLRGAVERHELVVHYQPIVSLKDERLVGWEALARWEHPERGLVSPAGFIPIAEETGLIVPIGRWVLEEACQQLREWQARFPNGPELTMSVNVSGRQFQEPTLIDDVAHALEQAGVDPACLTLELTESVLLENADGTLEQLSGLRDLGVRLAIDDFGTGYSSLSYLRTFPVDILKVDRSFIDGSGDDEEREALLQAILNLGRLMGLQTVGEGIERADQRDRLRDLQCDRGQGYYFARPASAQSLELLLEPRLPAQPTDIAPAAAA